MNKQNENPKSVYGEECGGVGREDFKALFDTWISHLKAERIFGEKDKR